MHTSFWLGLIAGISLSVAVILFQTMRILSCIDRVFWGKDKQ